MKKGRVGCAALSNFRPVAYFSAASVIAVV